MKQDNDKDLTQVLQEMPWSAILGPLALALIIVVAVILSVVHG